MKKLVALFSLLMLSLSVQATEFTEGDYYTVLDQPHSKEPIVTEYFSFYCPHCYAFEPIMRELQNHLPAGVKYEKHHVSFMGGDMGFNMSKAYATMVTLNVQDTMIPVMFDQLHRLRKPPMNVAELRKIFVDHGIDGKKFDNAFNSFAVDSMARRYDSQFQDHNLRGVPSVVVNNKYLVVARNLKKKEDYYKLIAYLSRK